ncbi:FAD:protein FMN transferase [Porticoccaceae bacterium LTM1]|nr:FAD:protein FMN transferase [Porticoccaceae bacterium LTM1]
MRRATLATRLLAIGLATFLLTACQQPPQELKFSGPTMGTTYHVTVIPGEVSASENLDQVILDALNRINDQMSTYQPDSDLSKFNELPIGEVVELPAEFAAVMKISEQAYTDTEGAFDPTVGPLVDLWGFGPRDTGDVVPDADAIADALAEMGFEGLELDGERLIKHEDVRLDLSAVAKGYAAELVSNELRSLGLYNHLVEVGGEMRLSGVKGNGERWKIGIEQPNLGQGAVNLAVSLTDAGVATSGDYRNYFEQNGVRYSHTIDPRTGYPVTHKLASVTVIADNAGYADAMATAFMVLGSEKSLVLAEKLDLAIYLIVKQGDSFVTLHSSRFEHFLN